MKEVDRVGILGQHFIRLRQQRCGNRFELVSSSKEPPKCSLSCLWNLRKFICIDHICMQVY